MAVALRLVDVGMAQRLHAVAEHAAAFCVDDGGGEAARLVLGRGDAVHTVLGEEIRPLLEPVVVEGMRIARMEVFDFLHKPMWLRHALHKPRTAVSVMRESPEPILSPPISITEARSGEAATPRCTKPVAAPSSIEM